MRLVVDASVAIKWVIEEHQSQLALALLDHSLIAPDLWLAECSNVLWKKVRAGELRLERLHEAIAALRLSGLESQPMDPLVERATEIAIALDHPAYDCFYLALAEAEECPLVTVDRRLANKLAASATTWTGRILTLGEVIS